MGEARTPRLARVKALAVGPSSVVGISRCASVAQRLIDVRSCSTPRVCWRRHYHALGLLRLWLLSKRGIICGRWRGERVCLACR